MVLKKRQDGARAVVALGVFAAAALGGCAGAVQPRMPAAEVEVVSAGARGAAFAGGQEWLRPEYQRRDADLAVAVPRAQLASDQWPEAEPPDLTTPWYIYLPRNERTQVFFVPRSYRYGR